MNSNFAYTSNICTNKNLKSKYLNTRTHLLVALLHIIVFNGDYTGACYLMIIII